MNDTERSQIMTIGEEHESLLHRSLNLQEDYLFETEEQAAASDTQRAMAAHGSELRRSILEMTKSTNR